MNQFIKSSSPFGSVMSERTGPAGSEYRYGFNGKEKDDEFSVDGGSYDFGARMYDARLGRWWSVDPKLKNGHIGSFYSSFDSNPISLIDPDGADAIVVVEGTTITIKARIQICGEGATSKMAQDIQESILKHWKPQDTELNGEKWTVKFEVEVFAENDPSYVGQEGDNTIDLIDGDPEYRSRVIGGAHGTWSAEPYLESTWAHEFGHLLGLADMYADVQYNPGHPTWYDLSDEEKKQTFSEPFKSADFKNTDEIMAGGSTVTGSDINAIAKAALWVNFKSLIVGGLNILKAEGMPLNKPTSEDLMEFGGAGEKIRVKPKL